MSLSGDLRTNDLSDAAQAVPAEADSIGDFLH